MLDEAALLAAEPRAKPYKLYPGIRRKIGDDFSEPWKLKRMHWRTFERYAARDAKLAGRENGFCCV